MSFVLGYTTIFAGPIFLNFESFDHVMRWSPFSGSNMHIPNSHPIRLNLLFMYYFELTFSSNFQVNNHFLITWFVQSMSSSSILSKPLISSIDHYVLDVAHRRKRIQKKLKPRSILFYYYFKKNIETRKYSFLLLV